MFCLVDGNNFYVSCERVFRPELENVPVAVLSNNDGCIIARSNEVKAMGVKMGAPYFQFREPLERAGTVIFSSNYELYGDMSRRMMEVGAEFSPVQEVYSIDEFWLDLSGMKVELEPYAWEIRRRIKQCTGLPVGVGIGPTKTLAKLANKLSKKAGGVCVLDTPERIAAALAEFPVGDVWGIGRQTTAALAARGITMASQLVPLPDAWIRQRFTVVGLRMVHELRGISCIDYEVDPDDQKGLAVTRSFSDRLTTLEPLQQAVAHYATRAGEKLRHKGMTARRMEVFIRTSQFSTDPRYAMSCGGTMAWHTDNTLELIEMAQRLLARIFKPGYRYSKAGIILSDMRRKGARQFDLLEQCRDPQRQDALMGAIDSLNRRYGRHTVQIAGAGMGHREKWIMQRTMVTPRYTTRWEDVPKIR